MTTNTDNNQFNIAAQQSSSDEEDNNVNVSLVITSAVMAARATKNPGQPYRATKWTEVQFDSLLDCVEEKLPTGSKHWEEVALMLNQARMQQMGVSAKILENGRHQQFNWVGLCPQAHCQSKGKKEKIVAYKVMGMVAKTNSSKDSNIFLVDQEAGLKGCQLFDDCGNLRCLKIKKMKTKETGSVILQLADQQKQNTKAISVALASMTAAMTGTLSDNVNELWTEVAEMATKLEGFRSKFEGLGSKFDQIMQKLLE